VARGQTKRLIVLEPPGHAKSTYTSKLFPSWLPGQPTVHGMPWDILATSHGMDLAREFSADVQKLVRENAQTLGYGFGGGTAEKWQTTKGDWYRCAGAGSSITGKRADIGIGDDWIKGHEVADSETQREKAFKWYLSDFRTRLKPGAPIVIVMTRWHEDDPVGRILPADWNGESGIFRDRLAQEEWEVVCLPALAVENDPLGRKPGEALWPEWMPADALERERIIQGPRNWNSLYQQQPAPDEGTYFKRDWFNWYDEAPKGLRCFLLSDFAVSEKESADFTVHQVWGVDNSNHLWMLDQWRGQELSDASIDAALDLVAQWKPAAWINERGVILKSIGPLIRRRMTERNVMVPLTDYARTGDKSATARTFQGRASQGCVHLPRNAPWVSTMLSEWLSFPVGKHDDQVDPAALLGLHLDRVIAPPIGPQSGVAVDDASPW
jgi:predicted phage terminase large subunit-like protein